MCTSNNIAAVKCSDATDESFTDWFLPSIKELELMWSNLADSDMNGTNSGPTDNGNLGEFANDNYWSSTPGDDSGSWLINFGNGNISAALRSEGNRVRAVRLF